MHGEDNGVGLTTRQLIQRMILLLVISISIGMAGALLFGGFMDK